MWDRKFKRISWFSENSSTVCHQAVVTPHIQTHTTFKSEILMSELVQLLFSEFTFQGTFQGPMMHITRELAYFSFQLSKLIIIGSNSVQKTPCNAPSPLDELNTFWLPLSGVAVSLGYQQMKHTECNKIYWTHLCFLEDVDQIYFPSVISLYYCIIMDPCSSFKPQPAGKV